MDITLWKTGHPVYQCGNTHVERCTAYDVESLQEAYHNVISQHSKYWNKYPEANPPYIEHVLKGWKLYFYPTKEEAEEKTQSVLSTGEPNATIYSYV